VLFPLSGTSCVSPEAGSDKIIVAVSILPQAGFVDAIGGDRVEVLVMVPPGADPHTYEVTPDKMAKLSRAVMYAKVGTPVEFELAWMDKLLAANKNMLVVNCSEGVQLLEMAEEGHEHEEMENAEEHEHEGIDPHIWLSVKNAEIMVRNICDGLVQVDPVNASYYKNNCTAYLEDLDKLDIDISKGLSGLENRSFIVFHPAFGYFAHDYDLQQIAVEQGGKEPSADYIVRLINEAKEQKIKIIFVSPQYSTKSAEVIAQEIGGHVAVIDPLARDFISNMRAVETAIKKAVE